MNTNNFNTGSPKTFRPKTFFLALALTVCMPAASLAGDLTLSNNALEVVTGVEPNIMILHDDSRSMDFGVMTEEDSGSMYIPGDASWPYQYAHPAPGATGDAPAINTYMWDSGNSISFAMLPTQAYADVVFPTWGVWRARNSDYNKVYYNPNVTYIPWVGLDSGGTAFANADPGAAPYNPFISANGSLNLKTTTADYFTVCPTSIAECTAPAVLATGIISGVSVGIILVPGYWPARYYEWTDDSGGSANGDVDADDTHTLVDITSGNAPYSRTAESSGGRSDCTDDGNGTTTTCTYDQEIQNFANWFTYYRKRDLAAKAALSFAIEPAESARIGYATINSRIIASLNSGNNFNIRVASMNVSAESGAKKDLLDRVFATVPFGPTPLKQALVDVGEYYDCNANDIFDSAGGTDCPIEILPAASPAGQCQQNYTVLTTDGYWDSYFGDTANKGAEFKAESSAPPTCTGYPDGCFDGGAAIGNTDSDSSNGYDGGAFDDGTTDYSNTLADVAMYYYEEDLEGGMADEVPTTTTDINYYRGATDPFETMHQHMSTYTVAFGVQPTLTAGPTDVNQTDFEWTEPVPGTQTTVDDLAHAGINGRGEYKDATDPSELVTTMESIFNSIETSTGTATAVAFNTQEVEAGTLVFRASFNTKTNKGDLVAQQVYANGTVDSNILWSAAEQLDSKVSAGADTRIIATYKDTGSNTSTGIPFTWNAITTAPTTNQETLLNAPQPANVLAATNTFGDERVGYLRGQSENEGASDADGEFRVRAIEEGKLGDIVHSTPVFVGKPSYLGRTAAPYPITTGNTYGEFKTAQTNRTELTYVGANDGMLHAFDTSNGSELFAYVPNMVIQNLSDLTETTYAHQYYVDLRPSINDVYFKPSATSTTNANLLSWNTVLVGGLAGGGKGYFALNITNPAHLDSESEVANNVMWEFTEADDGGVGSSDLGYSFSEPLIAMTNEDDGSGNKRWVAIFGNGYNSTSTDGDAALYVLYLEGGQDGVWAGTDFYKFSTGFGKTESADGTTPNGIGGLRGVDYDKNGTVDYVYAGDLQGNLVRFDLTDATSSNWGDMKLLFKAKYSTDPAQRKLSGSGTPQPITSRPIVIQHPSKTGLIVITATGSWMTTGDASSTDIQSIYGLWDDMTGGASSITVASDEGEVTMEGADNMLVEQTLTNHADLEHDFTVRTLTNNDVTWKSNGLAGSQVRGWYIDLDVLVAAGSTVEYPGERAVRNLQIRGNILFVNTIIPKSTNACAVGAGGFELAFNPETGGSGSTTIFDLNGDGSFDDSDNVNDTAGDANIITGIRFDTDTPTDSAFIGNRRMTQEGDNIRSFATNTDSGAGTARTSWREIVE